MFRFIMIAVVLLGLFGCGTMFGDKDKERDMGASTESSDNSIALDSQGINIPQKISFEIPKSIKNSEKDEGFEKYHKDEELVCFSPSYQRLKNNVSDFESRKADIVYNLDLARRVMSEHGDICREIEVGESCTIEDINDSISVEKIDISRYSMSEEYQYTLRFELTSLGDESKILQSISWTEDEKHVFSKMSLDDSSTKDISKIDYIVLENGDENMSIYDDILFKDDKKHDKFNLNITKSHIVGNYTVASNFESIDNDFSEARADYMAMSPNYMHSNGDRYNFFDSDVGELDKNGGYIQSTVGWYPVGRVDERIYTSSEYVTFDENGKTLSVEICPPGVGRCEIGESIDFDYCGF